MNNNQILFVFQYHVHHSLGKMFLQNVTDVNLSENWIVVAQVYAPFPDIAVSRIGTCVKSDVLVLHLQIKTKKRTSFDSETSTNIFTKTFKPQFDRSIV